MDRRHFSQVLVGSAALAGLNAPAWAQASAFKAGSDYRRLDKPAPVDSPPGQIEVIEFFSYTCIHCYRFEPLFDAWSKQLPPGVVAKRNHVLFNQGLVPLQRLYYVLEAMGQVKALHEKVFQAIHADRERLGDAEEITNWAVKQGLDRGRFTQLFNSFGVVGKARRATQLQDAYQVEGTPALGVAGRYYISGQGPRTLDIASALIAQEKRG